jgi:hypothetical protein
MYSKSVSGRQALGSIGLALAVIAIAVTGCAGASGASGSAIVPPIPQPTNPLVNSISVTGSGDAQGTPDVAYIQLGIDEVDGDVGVAIQKANVAMSAVRDAVKQQGIDDKDMQTVNFNVYPEDVTDKTTGQPTGQRRYHVQNTLNVKVKDMTKIGAVINAGLNAGANNVNGLSFTMEDPSKLEADARTKAIKDAQARAQQLADGLGVKLGKPVIVSEVTSGGPIFQPQFAGAVAKSADGGSVPISPGQQTVTVTINVTYAIAQ